jgi:hypothetical protein
MSVSYEVRLKDHSGGTVAVLASGPRSPWRALYFTHVENAPGLCRLELDGDSSIATTVEADYQIEVWRSDLAIGLTPYIEWEGFVVTINPETLSNGDSVLALYGASYLDLIRRRSIWYFAGTSYTDKSGLGETVIKAYVNQNAGPGATTPPRIDESGVTPGLSIQTSAGYGTSWSGQRSFRNLLDVISEIAAATGVAFDVIGTGSALFEFRVYNGQRGSDRTNNGLNTTTGKNAAGNTPVIFALERGNMKEPTYSESHTDEINAVLVMGQNQGTSRDAVSASDPVAIATSPWARREGTRNASQDTPSSLSSTATQVLEENMVQERFSFKALQLKSLAYGVPPVGYTDITNFYWFGDLVTAKYGTTQADKKLVQVGITVSSDSGSEEISITFSDFISLNLLNPVSKAAHRIQELTSRVDIIESRDPGAGTTVTIPTGQVVAVRIASTANLAAISGLSAIDGVTPVGGDRILLKNQSSGSENGIWLASSGAWTRASDSLVDGLLVVVGEGTASANTIWMLTTNNPIVAGTTPIAFSNDIAPIYLTAAEGNAAYAAISHVHSAADITTGLLATARGGTGANIASGYVKGGNPFTSVATIPAADYATMVGATGVAGGTKGAVPAPAAGDNVKFLRGDATWQTATGTTPAVAVARIGSTANIAALSGLSAIDGVTPIAGDRILLKDQSTGSQNGLWVAAAGAWARASDTLIDGLLVIVGEGTANANTIWMLTTNNPIVAGTTALVFTNDIAPIYLTVAEGNAAYAAISHTHAAADIISGQLAKERGGTGLDASATGPGYFKQTALGAAPTVAAILQNDVPVFTGASSSGSGTKGGVPQPTSGQQDKFLKGDSTWQYPNAMFPILINSSTGNVVVKQQYSSLSVDELELFTDFELEIGVNANYEIT